MAINEIKPADIVNKGVIGLADVPGLTTAEMQRRMDELATDVIIPKVNELVKDANATNESLNNFVNIRIYTSNGFATMAEDIYAEWLKLENGLGSVFLNNSATIFMGSYIKDSVGNLGSMILHENGSDNVYIWSTSGGKYSLNTVALNSSLDALKSDTELDKVSVLSLEENGEYYVTNALDTPEGVSVHGHVYVSHRAGEGNKVVKYIPNNDTRVFFNVYYGTWLGWEEIATNSDFATKSIESFITPNADFALGTTHNNAVKSGNVIKLNVFFYSGNNPIANGAIIGSVPSEYIPKYEQRMTVSLGARFGNRFIGTVVFKTDGTIVCDWQDSNLTAVGEISLYGEYLI